MTTTPSPLRLLLLSVLPFVIAGLAIYVLVVKLDNAQRERDQAQYERDGLREAARISGELLAARDAIDRQRTQELTHERNQNQLLQRAVDAGSQRLFVNATCPASTPADSRASGVADAESAELAANARPAYFALRDQLALSRQMILGLQAHVRVLQDHIRRACGR
ncbi:lysis system i-spanin subunit Rz [Pseudomonas chlororaphis]|uniref:lysis system i-spanin subunit Rz n=1 Tax=Pseudomonas chlororaphis TaxID=587753 RepID=UPI000F5711A2|nr:lysis system i-spanin subunit Rz [Pseudomonas chlororaphis]AZC59952.1 Phage outer membrane lytic protein Rz [Pseudomonas chlororaphis subsp. piscium]